jgi:hypothetical protein
MKTGDKTPYKTPISTAPTADAITR